MKTIDDIREHLAVLEIEAKARAAKWGYANKPGMGDGFGLTKYDCGLILTSLGQFLGYQVYGKRDWKKIVLDDQVDPEPDGNEKNVPYLERERAASDYTWFSGKHCVGVFETDGRDNRRSTHLPEVPEGTPVLVREHDHTNNLCKLKTSVLKKQFSQVPACRAWILFQVHNDYSAKNGWVHSIEVWRSAFAGCAELDGAIVIRDTELFSRLFLEYVAKSQTA